MTCSASFFSSAILEACALALVECGGVVLLEARGDAAGLPEVGLASSSPQKMDLHRERSLFWRRVDALVCAK